MVSQRFKKPSGKANSSAYKSQSSSRIQNTDILILFLCCVRFRPILFIEHQKISGLLVSGPKDPFSFISLSCNASLSYWKTNQPKLCGELTIWSTSFPFCLISILYYKLLPFTGNAELSDSFWKSMYTFFLWLYKKVAVRKQSVFGLS